MDSKINKLIEEYLELYNEALARIIENEEDTDTEENDFIN